MSLGETIFYQRKQKKMTQEELALGICSVPYLCKIEKNKAEPSDEIIGLLLNRLGVSAEKLKNPVIIQKCNQLLNNWYSEMKRINKDISNSLFVQIVSLIDTIQDSNLLNTYNLYKLRYHLLNDDLKNASTDIAQIKVHQKSFSLEQKYYWYQFLGLYETMNNHLNQAIIYYQTAEEMMKRLNLQESDFLYQLAHIYTHVYQTTKALIYSNKALDCFHNEANLIKTIQCHILLGLNYGRINSFDDAKTHYNLALNISNLIQGHP